MVNICTNYQIPNVTEIVVVVQINQNHNNHNNHNNQPTMTSQAVQTVTQWWIDNRIDNLLPVDFEPDLAVVLASIKAGYTELYGRLPSRLRQNDQIVSSVLEKAPDQLASVVDVLLEANEYVRAARHALCLVKLDPGNMLHAGRLLYNSSFVQQAVQQDGKVFERLDFTQRSSVALMLIACKTHPPAWKFASTTLVEQLEKLMHVTALANQPDQPHQPHQTDQTDQTDQIDTIFNVLWQVHNMDNKSTTSTTSTKSPLTSDQCGQ